MHILIVYAAPSCAQKSIWHILNEEYSLCVSIEYWAYLGVIRWIFLRYANTVVVAYLNSLGYSFLKIITIIEYWKTIPVYLLQSGKIVFLIYHNLRILKSSAQLNWKNTS